MKDKLKLLPTEAEGTKVCVTGAGVCFRDAQLSDLGLTECMYQSGVMLHFMAPSAR